MSRIKSMIGMAAMLTALTYGGSSGAAPNIAELKETEEERKKRLDEASRKRNISNGLTEYFYGQNSLWALNQKSADRKAKKRNWI